MRDDVIPDWVPDAVRLTAIGMQIDNDRLRRFLFDERMRQVWVTLRRQSVDERGFDKVPYSRSLRDCDVDQFRFTIEERACAAMYMAAIEISTAGDHPITSSLLEQAGRRYIETAEHCSWLAVHDSVTMLPVSVELANALKMVEQTCRDRWQFLMQKGNPRRLDISSGQRNDDVVRGHVRKLAVSTRGLYGTVLAGTLATIANVVFTPTKIVTEQAVRNWCRSLPSQSDA